jgi:hypothetical protein
VAGHAGVEDCQGRNGKETPYFVKPRGSLAPIAGNIEAGRSKAMKHETRTPDEATSRPPFAPPSAPGVIDTATLKLLEGWRLQDATDSREEISAAEQELTEFKRAMNENRTSAGEPLLYP